MGPYYVIGRSEQTDYPLAHAGHCNPAVFCLKINFFGNNGIVAVVVVVVFLGGMRFQGSLVISLVTEIPLSLTGPICR